MSRVRKAKGGSTGAAAVASDWSAYVFGVGAVWLAWQIMITPLLDRAPLDLAVRLAPGSASVLTRAARDAYEDKRYEDALALAQEALVPAPFSIDALNVAGLSEAALGREDRADEILTLSGNFSLRNDPAHTWLIQRRLRQGDLASAVAHAETLARRQTPAAPQVYKLFTALAQADPRGLQLIARLLSVNPPWRTSYLADLRKTTEGNAILAGYIIALQPGKGAATDDELILTYRSWLNEGRLGLMMAVRDRIGRPAARDGVVNGDFSGPEGLAPFAWSLEAGDGSAEITRDDANEPALRVTHNGFSSFIAARQLVQVGQGPHRLSFRSWSETPATASGLVSLTCYGSNQPFASAPLSSTATWADSAITFTTPVNCPMQWLSVTFAGGDRRRESIGWLDSLSITRPS
ncbi:hypothetical protein GVN24_22580 [Rhizobium sp. CRIBSB]|nr:hypothetical protein [Rhizobium sp. CRIBSB]